MPSFQIHNKYLFFKNSFDGKPKPFLTFLIDLKGNVLFYIFLRVADYFQKIIAFKLYPPFRNTYTIYVMKIHMKII